MGFEITQEDKPSGFRDREVYRIFWTLKAVRRFDIPKPIRPIPTMPTTELRSSFPHIHNGLHALFPQPPLQRITIHQFL